MKNENIPQESKTEILEQAVINEHWQALEWIFYDLGNVEMTARALGLACRFCGYDTVKVLVEGGASFSIPQNKETERLYHCYSGMKYANYRTNYSLYLLNITRQIKGACCCKGLKLPKRAAKNDGKYRVLRSDSERAKVLKYLVENRDRISFNPSEMLYYAIFAQDSFIVAELKKLGVKLSEKRMSIITNGGPISDSYWYEWTAMMYKLDAGNYLPVMERIKEELDGKPFHCTGKVYDKTKTLFTNADIMDFFRANFKTNKLNKTQMIRDLIDVNAVNSLPIAERLGWLDDIRRRDEMITYAQQAKDRVECVAWLLDFKNRTADFAAEREKAEKKALRELNADPNSVTELKKSWGFKTQKDGTLIITRYKGKRTEVFVPAKIGQHAVTAIGEYVFSPQAPRITFEQGKFRHTITRVVLPEGIRSIGINAFYLCQGLEEVVIPDGVVKIDTSAFNWCANLTKIVIPETVTKIENYLFSGCHKLSSVTLPKNLTKIGMHMFLNCSSLKSITLPANLKRIRQSAFMKCSALEEIVIPEGTVRIDSLAFAECPSLKTVVIPASVTEIKNEQYRGGMLELSIFDGSRNVTAIVEPNSYAEEYCKQNNIAFKYSIDESDA